MYGKSPSSVRQNLTYINWMPKTFGKGTHRLLTTKINNIHTKLTAISSELDELVTKHPEYKKFLRHPGCFGWRNIAHGPRLSSHSFGIAVDLNPNFAHYWQKDLKDAGKTISEVVFHLTVILSPGTLYLFLKNMVLFGVENGDISIPCILNIGQSFFKMEYSNHLSNQDISSIYLLWKTELRKKMKKIITSAILKRKMNRKFYR